MITREILLANTKMLEDQYQDMITQLNRLEGAIAYNKLLLKKLEEPGEPDQPAAEV